MLPVAVRFRAAPGDVPNRAGPELHDGFDAQGQTIRLDLIQGPEAAGALAWDRDAILAGADRRDADLAVAAPRQVRGHVSTALGTDSGGRRDTRGRVLV